MKRGVSAGLLTAATLGAAGAGVYAVFGAGSQMLGPVLVAPRLPGEVALTFDDGPNPDATPRLLDVLGEHQVRAAFFLIGENVLREPALARRIAAEGHVLGNHTMSHPWLPCLSRARIGAELRDCTSAIADTTGVAAKLFRPPHGARTPAVLAHARELGMSTVNWNVIVSDWMPQTAHALAARIAGGIRRRERLGYAANVVLHDGGHGQPRLPTVDAVESLLRNAEWRTRYNLTVPSAWL